VPDCIRALRQERPTAKVKAIIPDFSARLDRLGSVIMAGADVIAHNVEVVERLTPSVRDRRAGYEQSLGVLGYVKMMSPRTITKSSLMLGLGEAREEVKAAMVDLREVGVDILTLGQYLCPGKGQAPVERYASPHEFDRLGEFARSLGFGFVAAGPFVRSSYHAADYYSFITDNGKRADDDG
jgi:lipoic acid synthetase